nr:hypothetical protein [Tanacetum cinerariifolium]
SNDITRIQALVDKKKVLITEAVIRDALRLDDAEGVDCLPNEVIFAELAHMGYEKPSTKLTFYKAFFSSPWKFLIHTILQSMSAKRTSWNKFSSTMASSVICLSTCDDTAVSRDDSQDQSIPLPTPPTPPPQPPQDIPSTSQVQSPSPQPQSPTPAQPQGADFLSGRMIAEFDRDEGIALMDDKGAEKKAEDAQVVDDEQEAVEVVATAKLIIEVVAAISESVSAASANIVAVLAATITAAPVRVAAAFTR